MSAAYHAKGKPLDTSRVWQNEDAAFTKQWKPAPKNKSARNITIHVAQSAAASSVSQVSVDVKAGASAPAVTPAHRPQTAPAAQAAMFNSIREPNAAELKRLEAEEERARNSAPATAAKPVKCGCFG